MEKLRLLFILCLATLTLSGCTLWDSKVKAGLQVVTDDVKTSLFLNDQYLDKTPYINKSIKPGTYSLRMEPEDKTLATLETTITLTQGTLTVVTWNAGKTPETSGGVTYELQPHTQKDKAEVEFHTVPDTAIVTFDNHEQTFTPLVIKDVEPGNHEFEVTLPSYQTQKHTMNAVAGKRLVISIKLAKQVAGQAQGGRETTDEAAQAAKKIASSSASGTISAELSPAALTSTISQNLAGSTATDSVTVGSRLKILPTDFFQNQKEVLRVRDKATTDGKEIGFVEVGREYRYLKQHSGDYYQIQFGNKQTGWISDKFAQITEP